MAFGMEFRSTGSSALTRSTVSIMLAPGCLLKINNTAGLPFFKPVLRKSSTESTASPRSAIRTAAPLR